jgi:predicted RNA binding protein YcfA (HicA-like mRNA interferase family)
LLPELSCKAFPEKTIAAEATPTECRGDFPTHFGAQARYNSGMKVRAVIRRLKDEGWNLDRRKGSHRQFKHPFRKGLVTVPGKPGDGLAPGTPSSIFMQAGWK